jgi:hypothetical protein
VKFRCFLVLCVALSMNAEDITPHVGIVEVFGVRKVSAEKVKSSIGAKPGAPLPSRAAAEEKLNKLSGVVASHVQVVCCDGRQIILYVGIEERNALHIEFHANPVAEISLPKEISDKYDALIDAIAVSLRAHNADEDLTNGYSLMTDPDCRDLQTALIPLVAANLANVDQVLRTAADPEQREAAAYVIQYGPRTVRDSKIIADALQYALQDPDETVRKNAMISLKALMVGARLHRDQQIHIEPTWFVELMNSVVWSDRRNASLALLTMTDKRNPETLDLIRQRAMSSVIEMARWHDLQHALPGFILAGRLAGADEKEIQAAWVNGDRDEILRRAENPNGRHGGITGLLHHDEAKKTDY